MRSTPGEPESADLDEFDRHIDRRILEKGSRQDTPCPRCGQVGYRRVADSEMVALYACRRCGFQDQRIHEPQTEVDPPFREYREGRRAPKAVGDEGAKPG
jgi:predicted RNA-binding Zn-ribbon protein involved in translation (DUF1610 family)